MKILESDIAAKEEDLVHLKNMLSPEQPGTIGSIDQKQIKRDKRKSSDFT